MTADERETRVRELQEIRDLVERVANATQTREEDNLVFQMFGSLSQAQASGVVIGMTRVLHHLG